jgi:AraC-like DNA-binding protein
MSTTLKPCSSVFSSAITAACAILTSARCCAPARPNLMSFTMTLNNASTRNQTPRSDLAQLCYLSEDYFTRRLRECVGQSPSHYIRERRVTIAAQQLLFSSASINHIAAATGFGNRLVSIRHVCSRARWEFRPPVIVKLRQCKRPWRVLSCFQCNYRAMKNALRRTVEGSSPRPQVSEFRFARHASWL